MKALQRQLPIYSLVFANHRYFQSEEQYHQTLEALHQKMKERVLNAELQQYTIDSGEALEKLLDENPSGFGLLTAVSGSVQPWMLEIAKSFNAVGIFPGYNRDLMPESIADTILELNGSPSTLEVYSVLKNRGTRVFWIDSFEDIGLLWSAMQAVDRLKHARLLHIGGTESWVLSSNRDTDEIRRRLGLEIIELTLGDLYLYAGRMSEEAIEEEAQAWIENATELQEPENDDVFEASRVVEGLNYLLEEYDADGASVACFSMLNDLETTSCLAMSSLNDHPEFIGACEGDLDAAATLMLVKALTGKPVWMANPIVESGNAVTFAHCTAPVHLGGGSAPFRLRSHHESGIGVSPEVELPIGKPVTLVRIGENTSAMTVHVGETVDSERRPTCRTQLRIALPSREEFLETSLGNHQIIVYGDYRAELRSCAELLGLELRTD